MIRSPSALGSSSTGSKSVNIRRPSGTKMARRSTPSSLPLSSLLSEASSRYRDHHDAHRRQDQPLFPQVAQFGAAQDDAAEDLNQIGSPNDLAYPLEEMRHRIDRENIAREEDRGHHRAERRLSGLLIGLRPRRDQQPEAEHRQNERRDQQQQQKETA